MNPRGGPAGYLFNLKKGLDEIGFEVSFLPSAYDSVQRELLRRIVPNRAREFRLALKYAGSSRRAIEVDPDFLSCKAIHFQSTTDLYFARKFLESYQGMVLLTSHSPRITHAEHLARLNPKDIRLFRERLKGLERIDEYAFERADVVIFPCEEAEEPYFHSWPRYEQVRDERKLSYLATGVIDCVARVPRYDVRKHYGIPENAFVLSFVGRHDEIKGYCDLKELGRSVLGKRDDVWFLLAGREYPERRLDHPRWIEVGWTDDPHSLMAASDLFILPNRETFFDLVLLETLSLGLPVVASATGGNKHFKKFEQSGVFLYDDPSKLAPLVEGIIDSGKEALEKSGKINREIFMKDYTCAAFANRYVDLLSNLGLECKV